MRFISLKLITSLLLPFAYEMHGSRKLSIAEKHFKIKESCVRKWQSKREKFILRLFFIKNVPKTRGAAYLRERLIHG